MYGVLDGVGDCCWWSGRWSATGHSFEVGVEGGVDEPFVGEAGHFSREINETSLYSYLGSHLPGTPGRPLRGGGCLDDANLRPFFEGNLRGKKPKYCQSGS